MFTKYISTIKYVIDFWCVNILKEVRLGFGVKIYTCKNFSVISNHFLTLISHNFLTHPQTQLLHQGWTQIFLHTLLLKADHQYLNCQHLACVRFWPRADFYSWLKLFEKQFQCQGQTRANPIILWSMPGFSRMTSPNLMPKPTADIECLLVVWRVHAQSPLLWSRGCRNSHCFIPKYTKKSKRSRKSWRFQFGVFKQIQTDIPCFQLC